MKERLGKMKTGIKSNPVRSTIIFCGTAVIVLSIGSLILIRDLAYARENLMISILLVSITAIVLVGCLLGSKNVDRMVKTKTKDMFKLQSALLQGITNIMDSRDAVTGRHALRTQGYLRALIDTLNKMGLYQDEMKGLDVELVVESSQLHDVGKIAISDSILQKPGRFTPEEFESMKKHVEFGVEIIERIESKVPGTDFIRYAKIFAQTHHEKWDGTGYPKGLAGSDIPLLGRLMAIANVYDALTSKRPYKEAFPPEEAARIIREGKGSHFDPALVDAFEQVAGQFASIASQPIDQRTA